MEQLHYLDSNTTGEPEAPGIDRAEVKEKVAVAVGETIANRLTYLKSHEDGAENWLPVHRLVEEIGVDRRWIHRMIKEFGIEPEARVLEGKVISHYPPYTLVLLREERIWRDNLRALPRLLSVREMADNLGRSWGWTNATLNKLGIPMQGVEKREGFVAHLFSKTALKKLRSEMMAVPLNEDGYNLRQLVETIGEDRQWIERRLIQAGFVPELRRSALTGKIHEYYPPEAIEVIIKHQAEKPQPGADWYTAIRLATEIGKSYNWVVNRLHEFNEAAETRLDDNGVPRLHYPPGVYEFLRQERDYILSFPERGEYLTLSELAKTIGRSTLWARNRLDSLGLQPQRRRDKKDRVQDFYPPQAVETLLNISNRPQAA